jgi:Transposase DDE domain
MIPSSYQDHLKSQFSPAEYYLVIALIQILQAIKSLSLEKLATALPFPILFDSRKKKIQRLLMLPHLGFKIVWFPILLLLIPQLFPLHTPLYLAVDRTSWRRTNLLVVSLIYDKRAIPVYIQILDKKGSSNLGEQKQVLDPVIRLFKDYEIVVLGDREFCSIKLAYWLQKMDVLFALRLRKDEYIKSESVLLTELSAFGLKPGMSAFLQGVSVTKQKGFGTFNVAAKWQREYQGWLADEGWFILTNLDNLEDAINAYKKRFDIEELFRDCKSAGYNLEETRVTGDRLISLLVLMTLAYTMTTIDGKNLKKMGVQKYIGRIQEQGRSVRRHSSFYIGLYSHAWVNFYGDLQRCMVNLMRLNPNKRPYYCKGLRAMELVLSAL